MQRIQTKYGRGTTIGSVGARFCQERVGHCTFSLEHIATHDLFQETICNLRTDFASWSDAQRKVTAQATPGSSPQCANQPPASVPEGTVEETEQSEQATRLNKIRAELKQSAESHRKAFVSLCPMPRSVLACRQLIEGSAVYKAGQDEGSQGLCYLYATPCVWDRPRAQGKTFGSCTPALVQSDLEFFCETVNSFITSENRSYAVVLCGRSNRAGGGVSVEAGLALEDKVLKTIVEKGKGSAPWRVKKLTIKYQGPSDLNKVLRGVGGTLTERIFLFYRGNWPSELVPKLRDNFGGSTWDERCKYIV